MQTNSNAHAKFKFFPRTYMVLDENNYGEMRCGHTGFVWKLLAFEVHEFTVIVMRTVWHV